MQVVYLDEALPNQYLKLLVILEPRDPDLKHPAHWHTEVLATLRACQYDGVVAFMSPRRPSDLASHNVLMFTRTARLAQADIIACWIPRKSPADNEFALDAGAWMGTGKLLYGFDSANRDTAHAERYLRLTLMAAKEGATADCLAALLRLAQKRLGNGALRKGAERSIPLHVWQSQAFQSWYAAQRELGNELRGAKLEWTFRVGPNRAIVLMWALHVNVYVANEDREKSNEVILSRTDLASAVLYYPGARLEETQIVLVREFRSPVRNSLGFDYGLPGGSSFRANLDIKAVITAEIRQETGLEITARRLREISSRQPVATLSTHHDILFAAEITANELGRFRDAPTALGNASESERTYPLIMTYAEILQSPAIDWATIGKITQALRSAFPR